MSARKHESPVSGKHLFVIEKGQKRGALPKGAVTAEVGRHIRFNAAVLDTFDVKGFQPLHYDMLVLCAAIEFADRRWKRPLGWRRTLEVTVPVIDLKSWQKPEVLKSLHGLLNHLTGDTWQFSFVGAKDRSPIGSRLERLPPLVRRFPRVCKKERCLRIGGEAAARLPRQSFR